ncbi:hypothetical protein EG68_04869, partial [Paragonimus skrjabini miyazakii]
LFFLVPVSQPFTSSNGTAASFQPFSSLFERGSRSVNCLPFESARALATVPSRGPNSQLVGQCNVDADGESVPRQISLASSIRRACSGVDELRQEFLSFFRSNYHTVVSPATIFPKKHEGSYFINAGMNQFKPLFLGQSDTNTSAQFNHLRRATNSQPCIRIGGRHDDLNDVGYDRQHHTMFEMLGSWSFGDYYKAEACSYMWNFLTKVLGLPANALYVTYFGGCSRLGLSPDDQTRNIWLNLGVLDQKLLPFGVEHNFWRAGQSSGAGLCGPSTEIHVDFRGLSNQAGLRCARCLINTSSPQVMELWNCVFITHRLQPSEDGAFRVDLLEPLEKRFVDTGMGLERLACVMQGVTSTYDSDAFTPLLEFIHANATTPSWTPPKYGGEFLPFCRQHLSETTEEGAEANQTVVQRSLPKFLRNLIAPKKGTRLACPTIQCMELQVDRSHFHSAGSHSDQYLPDTDLITRWHRDTAYRLLVDHSRALAHSLADGLLPGRQGLALKLRQLIQRSTRAAVLTGLDNAERSVSLLANLVAEVAKRESLASASSIPALQGPSARQPSSLSYDEMTNLVNQEVRAFIPRVHDLELAFERCLEENPDCTHLSVEQVRGLIDGKYGVPVSWDMLCAQSHWAGLCVPDPITERNSNASGVGGGTKNRRFTSSVLGTPLARQLQDAHVPFTDDSAKYSYDRRTDDSPSSCASYVIPSCRSRVIGLLVPDPNTQGYLLITDRCQHVIPPYSNKKESMFGCLVERTNFFTKEGGQDYDTGFIRIGFTTLDVVRVEAVTSPVENTMGWVIHWCRVPQDQSSADLARLCFDVEAELLVDEARRVQLMRHHTGQHLFVWALDAYVRGLQSSGVPATFQHHGGTVHPDYFVVNAAIVNPSEDSNEDIDHLVDQVESLCRMVIAQKLVVQSVSVDWDRVATDNRVRRFPWVTYPKVVKTVCIGPEPWKADLKHRATNGHLNAASAELCSGTHLKNTADLFDCVVTSVRSRKHTVKEFTAIVGEPARSARLRGESLVAEALRRESEEASLYDLSQHIEWLSSVLSSSSRSFILPMRAREQLDHCLHRMKTVRAVGSQNHRVQSSDVLVDDFAKLLSQNEAVNPDVVLVTPIDFSSSELVIKTLLQLKPSRPIIAYGDRMAVCYFPGSSKTAKSTALNTAHAVARSLSRECAVRDWTVKARPLRGSVIDESNRYLFALLEVTQPDQPTTVNNPNEREVAQWRLLHAALENSANAVLFQTVASSNTLRST